MILSFPKDTRKRIFVKEAKKCLTYVRDYYIFPNDPTKEDGMLVSTQILAKVEASRLQKAVEGLCGKRRRAGIWGSAK